MSEIKETFLDLLHLAGMAMSNGRHMPSTMFLDRESYNRWCEIQERKKMKRFKYEIKRQNILKIEERHNEIILHISQKGKLEALKQQIMSTEDELPKGQLCVVSYDIPEIAKKSRAVFRGFLKRSGFAQLHKSTWHTRKNVVKTLKQLIDKLEINEWVSVFHVVG